MKILHRFDFHLLLKHSQEMKVLLYILCLFLNQYPISINLSGEAEGTIDNLVAKDLDLKTRNTSLKGNGSVIGLPDIDNTVFDFDVNEIIGFYLTQKDFDNFNSSDRPNIDGYLKIYSPKRMKNQEINNSNLDEMVQLFKKNFLESNWDKISEKIEELGTNLTVDSPILMENYQPNETTRTFITFNKIASETYEDFQISALNLMNIKNRLIWVVYYKSYTGPESIQDLKRKNDYLIGKIAMSNLEN